MANRFFKFFTLALLLVSLTACLPFGGKSGLNFRENTIPIDEEIVPDVVSFDFLKRTVLTPYCISCHAEMGDEKKLNFWIVKGNAEDSDLYFWMKDGEMPPERPATTRELEIVRRYIEQL